MNLRKSLRRQNGTIIDITSMVDVVFILLIFLLISTTFKTNDHAYSIVLPSLDDSRIVAKVERTTIYLDQAGNMRLYVPVDEGVENHGISVANGEELEYRLSKLVASNGDLAVSIKADSSVEYQAVMDAVSVCYKTGVAKVLFPFKTMEN